VPPTNLVTWAMPTTVPPPLNSVSKKMMSVVVWLSAEVITSQTEKL